MSKFIYKYIIVKLDYIIENGLYYHPKQKVQDLSQKIFHQNPRYELLLETGPDHAKEYKVALYLGEEFVASGVGGSEKKAEKDAAKNGIKKMKW